MDPSDEIRPTVTWEHFCQVTQLNIELLKDNAFLRERIKEDNATIHDLFNQRQYLIQKLAIAGIGVPAWWSKVKEVPDGNA